jgi:hypothetical protein
MLIFILVFGWLAMIAMYWFAYRLIHASAKEAPDHTKIANMGDLNDLNPLGKFGIGAL